MKIIEVMVKRRGKYARREKREGYKRKHLCIASITGEPQGQMSHPKAQ